MKNQCVLLIIALLVVSGLQAQNSTGATDRLHRRTEKNPSIAESMQKQEGNIQRSMLPASVDAGIESIVSPERIVCDSANSHQPAPFSYDFSSSTWPPANWQIDNPDGNFTWEYRSHVGKNGAGCVWMNNYDYDGLDEKDDFTLPVLDLSNLANANLTFDVAYRTYNEAGSSDTLVLLASSDCGTTWSEIYRNAGPNLATGIPYFWNDSFVPADTNWRKETVSLDSFGGNPGVWIKFRNINNFENNLYIDNIDITETIIAVKDPLPVNAMMVYPNPSNGIFSVEFNLPAANHARLSVFNAVGQEVMARELTPSTIGKISLDLSAHAAGVYYIRLDLEGRSVVKRLSLQ